MQYHIAEINIGTVLAPVGSDLMFEFTSHLAEINLLAEETPGFVWRLKDDGGNATSYRPYPDNDRILLNLTVWEDIDSLYQFTYRTAHAPYVGRRKEWFEVMKTPILALWWIPAGHIPTIMEAKEKLDHLIEHGPTPVAFTFKQRFGVEDMLTYQPQP